MFKDLWNRGKAGLMLLGAALSIFGSSGQLSAAANSSDFDQVAIGNKDSNVEVYVVTDWFCKACRELEPTLSKLYPQIAAKARLIFVDHVIHQESLNYVPFNLSFMTNNKDQYFKLRQVLVDLSKTTKEPTVKQVQDAISSLGVKYVPLSQSVIDDDLKNFNEFTQNHNIHKTPTVVVTNKSRSGLKVLVGDDDITKENIMKEIKRMEK